MKIWRDTFSILASILLNIVVTASWLLLVLVIIVGWYDWPWIAENIGVITFALAIGYGASKFTS